MKIPLKTAFIVGSLLTLLFTACNSKRGETRESQLENTAESLEAKAELIRTEVSESAEKKIVDAKELRETEGDEAAAKVLEKDASVTREVGEMRAVQLEEQAEKIRIKKQEVKEDDIAD